MTKPLLFPDKSTRTIATSSFPLLKRVLMCGLIFALPLLTYAFFTIKQGAPLYDGEVRLQGLTSKVNVSFDTHGVPSVFAKSDHDAFFAQGYLHASERLWQMELKRRRAKGTLSELFGESELNSDIWFKTLNLELAAKQAYLSLNRDAQDALQAYSNGVNAFIETVDTLPLEFVVLQNKSVTKWQPLDSLLIHKLLAFSLSGNMYDELRRKQSIGVISTELMQHFYPFDKEKQMTKVDDYELFNLTDSAIQYGQIQEQMRFSGSNAWVVAGKNTDITTSLLANDPHLAVESPSAWYQIRMKGNKLSAGGLSLAGVPGVMVGANENIGWGIASLIADQQDLYIYDASYPFKERQESIWVRLPTLEAMDEELKEVNLLIKETPLGPVISDALSKTDRPVVLRWIGLQDKDKSFEALYKLQYAANWKQFRTALSEFKSPGLHFLYADRSGNIGSQVVGTFPRRMNYDGLVPQLKLNETDNWNGVYAFESLPREYNPERGFIVAANEITKLANGLPISYEAAPGYRKDRITSLLSEKLESQGHISSQDMRAIQLDTVDLSAEALHKLMTTKAVLKAIKAQNNALEAQELEVLLDSFLDWDFSYSKESFQATLYHYWFEALKEAVISLKVLPNDISPVKARLMKSLVQRLSGAQLAQLLKFEVDSCAMLEQPDNKCVQLISKAFNRASAKIIKETKSQDPRHWQWQNVHLVKYENMAYKDNPLSDLMWNEVLGAEGSEFTVNVGNTVKSEDGGFYQTLGAAFRLVQYFSEGVTQDVMFPLGQSSHVMSPFYRSNQKHLGEIEMQTSLVLLPSRSN